MTSHSVRFLQQNARKSLIATKEILNNINYSKPDIVLIQEPYTSNSNQMLGLPLNSKLHYVNTSKPKSGILVTNRGLYTELLSNFSNSNITTIKIQLQSTSLIICNVYIEPNSLTSDQINLLSNLLDTFKHQPIILTGDFNSRHHLWHDTTTNNQGIILAELINDYELSIHNTKDPTCITTNGSSIIDLTLTNNKASSYIIDWHSSKQPNSIFDHVSISFTYNHQQRIPTKTINSTSKFNENKADWQKFKDCFNSDVFNQLNISINNIQHTQDIDKCALDLTKFIQEAAYKSIPTKKHNPRKNYTPWWDKDLTLMQITVRNLRNLYSHEKNTIVKQMKYEQYKRYRNKYVRAIYNKKQQKWREFLEESSSSNTWGNTYKMIKATTNPKTYTLPILDNAQPHQHGTIIENILDAIFPDDNQLLQHTPTQTSNILNQEQLTITPEYIETLIKSTNNKKSPGPDYITNQMLKQLKDTISPTLAALFTKCFILGHFPSCWKNTSLIIFPKPNKTEYHTPKNYRPISLISNISKILEKIIQSRLQNYIRDNNLQNENQHGFTQQKSTITALYNITNDIINNKTNNKLTSMLSVDYSGAFDNANWQIITKNMDTMNIPSQYTQIIQSYLTNRTVSYKYNNHTRTKKLTKGCPQGSPLSPTLWNILINSLLNSFNIPSAHIHAYADDITVICTGNTPNQLHDTLQKTLTFINVWSNNNFLTINTQKTQIIHFHKKTLNTPVTLNNNHIEIVDKIKILGISLQNHQHRNKINFNTHIENIISKTTRIKNTLFNFCKNTYGINTRKRQNLYKGLIRPVLTYGSEIWINHITKKQIQKLESTQHQILRHSIMGYRTISKACTTLLTRIEPIHTNIQIKQTKFLYRQNIPQECLNHITIEQFIDTTKQNIFAQSHEKTNDTFKHFFPSPYIPKFIKPNFILTQFYTGHGNFQKYLNRFQLSQTDCCTCSNTTQDVTHLLLHCTNYTQIKHHLQLHNINSLHQFTQNKEIHKKFIELCKHIHTHIKAIL